MNIHRAALAVLALLCLAGCAGEPQGGKIVIGSHLDLSGPIVAWGAGTRDGMQFAVDEINAAGGIHGRHLQLIVEDNGYDPRKAVLAVRKLLQRDKVFAIIAPLGSPPVAATLPLVLKAGVLHLFPRAAAPITYTPHHALKFVYEAPYAQVIAAGVRYMVEEKDCARAGILYQDDEFGLEIRRGAKEELTRLGRVLAAETSYKRGSTDFSTQIARLKAASVECVILGTIVRETVGAARAARALNWRVPILCSSACYTPETIRLGGNAVEGMYSAAQALSPDSDSPDPKIRAWLARYQARFSRTATIQTARGYSAIQLFAEGLRRAGSNPTRMRVARALEAMPPWTDPDLGGVPVEYTADDHIGVHAAFIIRVEKGKWRVKTGQISTRP